MFHIGRRISFRIYSSFHSSINQSINALLFTEDNIKQKQDENKHTPKISDDHFLVIDHIFLVFTVCKNAIYNTSSRVWPSLHQKNLNFGNKFLGDTFSLSSYFRRIWKHNFSKYARGGRMHGPSPPQILEGPPPVP